MKVASTETDADLLGYKSTAANALQLMQEAFRSCGDDEQVKRQLLLDLVRHFEAMAAVDLATELVWITGETDEQVKTEKEQIAGALKNYYGS